MHGSGPPLRLGTQKGDIEFSFETRRNVRASTEFHPAELALLDVIVRSDPGRVLVLGETYGAVGIPATTVADRVGMATWRATNQRLCEKNVSRNEVAADVSLIASPADIPATFDIVVYAPREYIPNEVVAQRMLDALDRVDAGGQLFFAAADTAGGAAYARTIREYTPVTTVDTASSVPVRRVDKPDGFVAPAIVEPCEIQVTIEETTVSLRSIPGLFAAGDLDHGTRLLLETISVSPTDRMLDLACGYGPIGAFGLAQNATAVLTDDSRPATKYAEATLAANDLTAPVYTAPELDAVTQETFDLVATNPPTHAGAPVLERMFGSIEQNLNPGGRLRIVHHTSLDLDPYLDDALSTPEILATGTEHVILGADAPQ